MYVHSDTNLKKEKNNKKNNQLLSEKDLEKFYEERQSFFEESLNNSRRTNTTKSTNRPPMNKKKYKRQNFDNLTLHRNILPENIISYEDYKTEENEINDNSNIIKHKKSKTKRSFSYKNINLKKEEKEELKREINELKKIKNRNESEVKYRSFRDKKNKTLNSEIKDNNDKKLFEPENKKNQAITLFPRKIDNFKPEFFKKEKNELENDISPIQTQTNNSNILTTKNSILSNLETKINENYKKDLYEVLDKRRDLDNIINNSKSIINKRNNNNLNVYERNKLYSEKSKEKIKILKEEKEKKEIEECSFNPQLTDQNITNKLLNESNYNKNTDFYNKNLQWQKKINQSIRDLIVSNEKKTYEECSFQPNTNNKF
jgi:hypothetical protein